MTLRRYPETPERRAERIRALADEAAEALRLTPGQHRTLFGPTSPNPTNTEGESE